MNYFDLQMFANPNTNTTGSSFLTAEMKTFYDTQLLENARNENVFNQFGKKTALPKNGGKEVEWRRIETYAPALTPLTEGVTPDGNTAKYVAITQEIDQYGDYTTVSDRLDAEAVDPVISDITEEHAAQAGDTLDIVTRNEVVKGTNVIYAGGKTSRATLTTADKLTPTLVNKAVTFLKKQHAPKINGDYIAIIHPSCSFDLRESQGWLNAHEYASPEEIYNGEIGKLHGCRFVESTNQKVWVEGGKAVYAVTFMGKDAYGIIDPSAESLEVLVKPLGAGEDPLSQRATVGWKGSHAAKILYNERLVRVECMSEFSAEDVAN